LDRQRAEEYLMGSPPNPSLNILIVDDYPDAADTLAILLKYHGFKTVVASDSADATRQVDKFVPDVLILDIAMPDVDGYALAKRLCAALKHRPLLIAVSGHHHLEGESEKEGFDYHFLKPFVAEDIVAILNNCALTRDGPVQ
jgi:DNA-binding response OmpR family regulator